ncbi:MAG: DNA polymerase, partial [Dehalococcoidia bacterium]|nr:DNA polymerase [Dehalococcoidia bacterium]
ACNNQHHEQLIQEAVSLTGLDNPNSVAQLKGWLKEAEGLEVDSLNKTFIPDLLQKVEGSAARRVLELRQQLAKTSIKKYQAMANSLCQDERVRGLMQFYGANRSGRWAGRQIQVHNLPRNDMPDLELARQLLRTGYHEALMLLYDSLPDVLSQLIRTAFLASEGCRFIVADFSAIEARVLAWLADERWRLEVFADHGKIYEASAAQMFRVPIESIDKGSPLRQKGKIAELALGYGGSKGALLTMGALDLGLTETELPELVKTWRAANPAIVKLWGLLNEAAITAVRDPGRTVRLNHNLTFSCSSGILSLKLPSGRALHYVRPRVETDPNYGHPSLTYEGYDQGRWQRQRTYGGKLSENVTQAVARDCLAEAMLRSAQAGYEIAFHVHDELVLDAPHGFGSSEHVAAIMSRPIDWAPGLPLAADGFETNFYQKG